MKYAAMEYQLMWKNESTGEVHFAYVNCEDDKNALLDILQDNDSIVTHEPAPMVALEQNNKLSSLRKLLENHINEIDHHVGNLSIDPELNAELIMDLNREKDETLRVTKYLKQPTDEWLIFRVKHGELGGGKTITKVFGEDNAIKIVRTLNETGGEYYYVYMTQI